MRTSGGIGLGGIVIIVGLLYFTGAGTWILNGLGNLSRDCSTLVPSFATSIGYPVCSGFSKGVGWVTDMSGRVGHYIKSTEDWVRTLGGSAPRMNSLNDVSDSIRYAISDLASPRDTLNEMIRSGPQNIIGRNPSQQFRQAVDNFTIGQVYINRGGVADALPWLQQSARQPEGFGVMSQLSLGNIYSNGGGGVAPDAAQAQNYYQMASDSLAQLSVSRTPEAQQMLSSLPASPQEIQSQIRQAMSQLHR